MAMARFGRWGANLAVRIPLEIVEATGLSAGECVSLEVRDGDIVIHRNQAKARARADALTAVEEIVAERGKHSLGGQSIRELIDEGRR